MLQFSLALLFFVLATSVTAAPTPSPAETELQLLTNLDKSKYLERDGGKWYWRPSEDGLPSQMVGPKPILSIIFTIRSSETPRSLYLRTVQHDVPNTLPSSSMPVNVARLAGLNRNGQYKGLTVGYWERHPFGREGTDMIRIVFQDNEFKWARLTETEREHAVEVMRLVQLRLRRLHGLPDHSDSEWSGSDSDNPSAGKAESKKKVEGKN
ncbi:hypothetical protein F5887DRAFT_988174 [Amanita rubescens]|nr:hypothetical protein F5887DRAFT_988174 [Amanita rubescens]